MRHAVAQHVTRRRKVKVKVTPGQAYVGIEEMWEGGGISPTHSQPRDRSAPRPGRSTLGKDPVSIVQGHPSRRESF